MEEPRHIDVEPRHIDVDVSNPSGTLTAIISPIVQQLRDTLPDDLTEKAWWEIAAAFTEAAVAGVRVGIAEATAGLEAHDIHIHSHVDYTPPDRTWRDAT